jgi:DNA repair protein RAD16
MITNKPRLTRMRQMACHPDLVLKSKSNATAFGDGVGEATVCRLCNDVAEDAIQSKCHHIFDRECIKQYLNTAIEPVVCPVRVLNPITVTYATRSYSRLVPYAISL